MNKFGLLGEKLGHSASPQIHKMLGSYEYKLYEKQQNELEEFLLRGDFDGVNVTIPYKKSVIKYCAGLSDTAKRLGSVNVLLRKNEGLFGYNTDYYGFMYLLFRAGVAVCKKKAVVLGNGGAARSVIAVLCDLGAESVTVLSRQAGSGENTLRDISERVGIDSYENLSEHYDAQIIVNTTPVGMYPNNGKAAVDLTGFKNCEAVLDIICNPLKTKLILQAQELGIKAEGGLYMLVAQAKLAAGLFMGEVSDDAVFKAGESKPAIEKADEQIDMIRDTLYAQSENIVLIGMPGCGKTTVAKELSRKIDKPFIDCDAELEKEAGKTIPQIFAQDGEDVFRSLETKVLERITAVCGQIIATGGGVVTRSENKDLLRQNGRVIFLERDIYDLPSAGRPLSQSVPIEKLYEQRIGNYRLWSDFACSGKTPMEVVKRIISELDK